MKFYKVCFENLRGELLMAEKSFLDPHSAAQQLHERVGVCVKSKQSESGSPKGTAHLANA
jgi:hypothetical protein